MTHKITLFLFITLIAIGSLFGQQTITVNANSNDISDNLDLEAVAYLFGEAKNLEEFEKMLNNPEKQVSNLDLNNDGYVDYLRVIESNENGVYVVVIQSVLGKDLFQDVATIDVDGRDRNKVAVQVIGNEYIYGVNYIIEPVYVHRPYIFDFFWDPFHVVWHSPYYWSYYPGYYHYRKPHRYHTYYSYVHHHYHHVHCRYVSVRTYQNRHHVSHEIHRNDYAQRHPDRSFVHRNNGFENRQELTERRSKQPNTENRRSSGNQSITKTREVKTDWQRPRTSSTTNQVTYRRGSNSDEQTKSRTYTRNSGNSRSTVETKNQSTDRSSGNHETRPTPTKSATSRQSSYTKPDQRESRSSATYQKPSATRETTRARTESRSSAKKSSTVSKPRIERSKPSSTQKANVQKPSQSSKRSSVQKSATEGKRSGSSSSSRSSSSTRSSEKRSSPRRK